MKKFYILIIVHSLLIVVNFGLLFGVVRSAYKEKRSNNTNTNSKNLKNSTMRIVGGEKVKISAHPYMAGMILKGGSIPGIKGDLFQCGASIITDKGLLTAAHCIGDILKLGFTKNHVLVTSNNADWTKGNKREVKEWAMYQKYNPTTFINDIGLVMVDKPFTGKYEKRITIASSYPYYVQRCVMVIGWGVLHFNSTEIKKKLRGVTVPIVDDDTCKRWISSGVVQPTAFCAGCLKEGKDACLGDSGGPIFDGKFLIGVASAGYGCPEEKSPGFYTKVVLYIFWITSHIKSRKNLVKQTFVEL